MALRLNTSEKNEIMPRRKARAEKPRLAQMLLRSGSLAGVESFPASTRPHDSSSNLKFAAEKVRLQRCVSVH